MVGEGRFLMQWANNGGTMAGTAVRYLRPTFTTFDLTTMTADPPGS